jgi:hypothetical protein
MIPQMLAQETARAVINERLRQAEGGLLAARARERRAEEAEQLRGPDPAGSRPRAVAAAAVAAAVLLLAVVALVATAFA